MNNQQSNLVRVCTPEHIAALLRERGDVECACLRWFRPFGGVTQCEECAPDAWADEKARRDLEGGLYMLHVFLVSGVTASSERSGRLPPGTVERHRAALVEHGINPDADPREEQQRRGGR